MVRNKNNGSFFFETLNNGSLEINFRSINEKQTNPRFLSAYQNLLLILRPHMREPICTCAPFICLLTYFLRHI